MNRELEARIMQRNESVTLLETKYADEKKD
jgi:hypothetical protein